MELIIVIGTRFLVNNRAHSILENLITLRNAEVNLKQSFVVGRDDKDEII